MHRDIKAGNIIYNKKLKRTNLIDFGISEYMSLPRSFHYRVISFFLINIFYKIKIIRLELNLIRLRSYY